MMMRNAFKSSSNVFENLIKFIIFNLHEQLRKNESKLITLNTPPEIAKVNSQ